MAFVYAGQYGPELINDSSGRPLTNLSVAVYTHTTTSPVTLYTDRTMATEAPNPTVTDALGNLTFYCAPGVVDIVGNGTRLTINISADPADVTEKAGDTMTGPLILSEDPVADLQAATKEYVDDSGGGGGTITLIESTDASVTVTGGTGPTVDLSVAAGGVTSVTAADGTLTVTPTTGSVTAKIPSSVALPGSPTTTTQSALDDSTKIATTAYADTAVGVEKTRALAAEALLAPLASPALTGTPTAPTKTALTNNTDLATTAYADTAVGVETTRATAAEGTNATAISTETTRAEAAEALLAPLASPALTGTPTAPTKSPGTNNTDIATTAYADAIAALKLSLTGGTMSGAIAMGANKITGLTTGTAASDAANVGQLPVPAPFPLPGAVNLQGHSYLGAINLGIPEPMLQGRYTASRIAAMLGAPNDSVVSMIKASGYLTAQDGPDGSSWGTVLQRLIPPGGAGLTAKSAAGYLLAGQVNPPIAAIGQPTMVSLIGINDVAIGYNGGLTTFTASLNGAGGVMTSATDLSSTGSYAAGRSGGNGLQVGDCIGGLGIRGYAQAASVTRNASSTITAATNASTTVTCTATGTYVVGELVTISGASGGTWTNLNGTWAVTVGGSGSFQAVVSIAPTGSYAGSTATVAANTVITFSNTAQILSTQTSQSYAVNFEATSGSSNFPGQGVTACINVWTATVARHVAGAIIRSDDAVSGGGVAAGGNGALTYTGTWTQPAQVNGNSGPNIAQTTVNGSTVTYTLPATHPGGMISLIGVGTSDLDTSTCSITLSGTAANATGTTTVARAGWAGFTAPVVVRIKTTAADAGKTIIITFNANTGGSNDLHQYQFDSINFDAPYQSPFIFVTQPPGCSGFGNTSTNPTLVAALNGAMTTVQTNFQNAAALPGGTFPAIGNITPSYTNVVVSDFAALLAKKSFYLGSTITTSTTTPVTLIGQRTIAQGDQQPPYAGQQIGIPSANVGDYSEVALITAVLSGPTPSGPGSAYNSWTVTLTRNALAGTGNMQAVAATGSTSSLISPLYDMMWLGPDYIHPGDVGSALIASNVLSTFLTVPNSSNFDFLAAGSHRWLQGRTQPYPRPYDGGVWIPKGTIASFTPATNTAYAMRYYASEDQVITAMGYRNGATGGTQLAYFGILQDASYGSYPGAIITDFGLTATASMTAVNTYTIAVNQLLKPGWYWLVIALNNGTPAAGKGLANRTDEPNIDATTLAQATTIIGTNTNLGLIGYSWAPTVSGAAVTNIAPGAAIAPGTATQIIGTSGTAEMPLIIVQRYVQKYSAIG